MALANTVGWSIAISDEMSKIKGKYRQGRGQLGFHHPKYTFEVGDSNIISVNLTGGMTVHPENGIGAQKEILEWQTDGVPKSTSWIESKIQIKFNGQLRQLPKGSTLDLKMETTGVKIDRGSPSDKQGYSLKNRQDGLKYYKYSFRRDVVRDFTNYFLLVVRACPPLLHRAAEPIPRFPPHPTANVAHQFVSRLRVASDGPGVVGVTWECVLIARSPRSSLFALSDRSLCSLFCSPRTPTL